MPAPALRDVWFAWVPFKGARENHPVLVLDGPFQDEEGRSVFGVWQGTSDPPEEMPVGYNLLLKIDPAEWPQTGLRKVTHLYRQTFYAVPPDDFDEPRAGVIPPTLWNLKVAPIIEAEAREAERRERLKDGGSYF